MKRLLCAAVVLMLGCQASTPDVRNARWGMSREQVKATETAALTEDEKWGLDYRDRMVGAYWVEVQYRFHGDALSRVYMKINPETDSLYVDVLQILTEKYGPPIEKDDQEGRDGTILDREWTTPRTDIKFLAGPGVWIQIWYAEIPRTLEESKSQF